MGISQAVRPLFSAAVRQRGETYADLGAVGVVQAQPDYVQMKVLGSSGAPYEVMLEKYGRNEYDLECTCPHYDDGNYCKHLWAAVRTVERLGLLGEVASNDDLSPAPGSRKKSASKGSQGRRPPAPAAWKTLLDRSSFQGSTPRFSTDANLAERRVVYLLPVTTHDQSPEVELYQQHRLKNGEWGKPKPLRANHQTVEDLSAAEDRLALGLLLGNRVATPSTYGYYDYYSSSSSATSTRIELEPAFFNTVLPALAATGRFFWMLSNQQDWEDARPIAWDESEAWRFRLRAELFDRRRQWRLSGELVRGEQSRPLSDAVCCYSHGLLLMDDRLARFEAPADYRWVNALRANSELRIPASDRATLVQELWRSGAAPEVVGDDSLCLPQVTGVPRGRLVVHPPQGKRNAYRDKRLYASVGYLYDGKELSPNSPYGAWLADDGARMITRDLPVEAALFDRLRQLGLEPKGVDHYGETPPGHLCLTPTQLNGVVDALLAEGWLVEAEGARIRRGGIVSVSVRSGVDWFDLDGTVDFDGVEATFPDLLAALRAGDRYIKLGDGSQGLLPQEWIERYAALGDLAAEQSHGTLRFQTGQALLLDSLLSSREASLQVEVDRQFAAWRRRLQQFSGVKSVASPRELQGELRDYQREGLGWLRFLEKFGFGGCLADDMGLGKTIQVLSLLVNRKRRQPKDAEPRPSLVVAPKSLVYNWRLEAERFAPRLKVVEYVGTDRHARCGEFAEHDLVLTTYGTLRQDVERLSETPWDYAILDEAQAIKNHASQSAKASRILQARHRLALSGTPVENHLGELWSIFEFLNPGLLGKSRSPGKLARGATAGEEDAHIDAIRRGVAPFLLRRTKQQVLPQLPKKSQQILYCDLPPAQRKQYDQLRDHYRASLDERIAKAGLARSKVHVLEALLRLRQASCHPGLLDERQAAKPSAKLELLLEQLTEIIAEGHKALVFSQFTKMLAIVRNRLDKAGVVYEFLDGKTRDRQDRVERFQSDDACSLFLISLKAGGCGLNLTAAEYVYLLDPWWNPAVEAQAIDRAHRIGQDKPVFAYRLIARDTVEEKILELQKGKRELAKAIVTADSSLLRNLTAADLQMLLE